MAAAKKKPLLALTALLAGSDETVSAVQLALADAAAYLKQHRKALAERAIIAPRPNLPWIALIDALAAEKRLVELDHRTDAQDAAAQLTRLVTLPKKRGRFAWLDERNAASRASSPRASSNSRRRSTARATWPQRRRSERVRQALTSRGQPGHRRHVPLRRREVHHVRAPPLLDPE